MILGSMLLLAAQTAAVPAPVLMADPPILHRDVPQPPAVTAPVPRQPLTSLFSFEDYPAALKGREGRRGAVSLKLTADPGGRLVACTPVPSSGEQLLDMATCNILRRRARFTPAVDASGAPTSGTVEVTVDWDAIFQKFGQR